MYDWHITRTDNGHSWYCRDEELKGFLDLAEEEGYTITFRLSTDEERAIMYGGI